MEKEALKDLNEIVNKKGFRYFFIEVENPVDSSKVVRDRIGHLDELKRLISKDSYRYNEDLKRLFILDTT